MSGLARKTDFAATSHPAGTIPPQVSNRSAAIHLGLLTVGGALAILLAGDSPSQMIVTVTLIFVAYALAWNIVAGFAGQFTFGHSAFFGLGAFMPTLLTVWTGLPPLFGVWLGVVAAAVAAAIIGAITLKLRGLYFGLVTVVFPTIFAVVATYLGYQEVSVPFNFYGGPMYFSPSNPSVLSCFALGACVLILSVTILLLRSRYGLFFGAVRADQDAAEACAIQTTRVKMYALVISAALSAVAGGLYASVALVVTPNDVFGLQMSVEPVLFTVFGGLGTLLGPILGAAILVPLSEFLTATFGATFPTLSGLVYGGALLLVITLFPAGLAPVLTGLIKRVWGAAGRSTTDAASAGAKPVAVTIDPTSIPAAAPVVAYPGSKTSRSRLAEADDPAERILEVSGIFKAFGGTRVLEDVTLTVGRGEIVGVIGPNGAGKTTLFNVINGFLRADGGSVNISGQAVTNLRPSAVARCGMGRTFQTVRLFTGMSVVENVMAAASARSANHAVALERTWAALDEVEMTAQATTLVDKLTTGELRRLELARAMATAGPGGLLLLDEFLGGLTSADSGVLLGALNRWREHGGSILAIEHTMRAMVGFVDRFVVLNFGKVIAEGLPDEIWQNREVVKAYLGDKWVA